MHNDLSSADAPRRQLSLLDSTSIIVGIVIGAGVFETTPLVAHSVGSPAMLMLVWVLGGVIALCGALCYAELATKYPRDGGAYVFLNEAYGRPVGFVFAWADFWIVRPGNIGAMAYVFARYGSRLFHLPLGRYELIVYASGAIGLLSVINLLGVRSGKRTQNFLNLVKIFGLLTVFAIGLFLVQSPESDNTDWQETTPTGFQFAMIMVLFTYGGWNDMTYVAAEVRNPRKNLFRALILGTLAVTFIYLLLNVAFLHALGLRGFAASEAVAAEVVEAKFSGFGGKAISLLVCVSCLGAINGMLFTGSRIYYTLGTEHRLFAWLGRWSAKRDTPFSSLLMQATVTLALVAFLGPDKNAFQRLVIFTTPIFMFFLLLVGIALFILRRKQTGSSEYYRVVGYPVPPLLFCLSSLFMLYASISWAWENKSYEALWSIVILVSGIVLSQISLRKK